MSEQNTPQNEEVDLGQLFKMIGNMFSRFFNFIASIFTGAFRFLIVVLIHFYRNLLWYAASIIIGLIAGFLLDNKADKQYGAHLYIETNFDSSRQVYENIQNLNQLASKDRDSVELGNLLGIKSAEAGRIKGFQIEPDIDENTMIMLFGEYRESLDSVSKITTNYENFKKNLSSFSFDIHKIQVQLGSEEIPENLSNSLVEYLGGNDYLKSLRDKTKLNFDQEIATIEKQSDALDSLIVEYLNIRLNESKRESETGSSTNLFMSNGNDQNRLLIDESKLLDKKYRLAERKREIIIEKLENNEIINVISDFPKSGYDISTITSKNKFKYPLVLFGFTFSVLMIISLGKYLKKQDKLLNNK